MTGWKYTRRRCGAGGKRPGCGRDNDGGNRTGSGGKRRHFGEFVQLDGSFHEWLEERGPRGCLMHMVDDATTKALGWFSAEETIWAAAGVLRRWIERYGVPQALCTDWKNVLWTKRGHFYCGMTHLHRAAVETL
jgi:hypothetical protein